MESTSLDFGGTCMGIYDAEEPNLSRQTKRGANVCDRANIFEIKVSDDMINDFEG